MSEIQKAHNFIIQTLQNQIFSKEIAELQNPSSVKPYTFKSSPLRKLNPFLDNNILRVGGRIKHSNIQYNHAHPIILPNNSHITGLIIDQYLKRLMHSGAQNTLANLRLKKKYWPINGRTEVKKVIHRCVRCERFRAQACEQQMACLPESRVSLVRAFTQVGIDFSGAIYIRSSMLRKCNYNKGYICLFVCMATKALHLRVSVRFNHFVIH